MLGGTNYVAVSGINEEAYYFIDKENIIDYDYELNKDDNYLVFSLEEFLEKYPFKIDDKVIDVADGCPGIIDKMKWDENVYDMKYCVAFGNGIDFGWYTNDTIKFYQSENSEDIDTTVEKTQSKRDMNKATFMITHMMLPETPYNVNDELEYKIIDGYEFDRVENDKIILKVVKHKYPTTYEECCEVIGINRHDVEIDLPQPYQQKMFNFFKLHICYDAYRKIAGTELGLDKPWEPDWNTSVPKYVIACTSNGIEKQWETTYYKCLAFSTTEMRDVFYENFKDLIENCKELL